MATTKNKPAKTSTKATGVYTNDAVFPDRVMLDIPIDFASGPKAPHFRKVKALALRISADLEELALGTNESFPISAHVDDFRDANGTWWTGIRIVIELCQDGMEAVTERKAAITICNQVMIRTWLVNAIAALRGA